MFVSTYFTPPWANGWMGAVAGPRVEQRPSSFEKWWTNGNPPCAHVQRGYATTCRFPCSRFKLNWTPHLDQTRTFGVLSIFSLPLLGYEMRVWHLRLSEAYKGCILERDTVFPQVLVPLSGTSLAAPFAYRRDRPEHRHIDDVLCYLSHRPPLTRLPPACPS